MGKLTHRLIDESIDRLPRQTGTTKRTPDWFARSGVLFCGGMKYLHSAFPEGEEVREQSADFTM
jgi:hypothetical protein